VKARARGEAAHGGQKRTIDCTESPLHRFSRPTGSKMNDYAGSVSNVTMPPKGGFAQSVMAPGSDGPSSNIDRTSSAVAHYSSRGTRCSHYP
jgi:hypothetical protein